MKSGEKIIQDLKQLADEIHYDKPLASINPDEPDKIKMLFTLNNGIGLSLVITKCSGLSRYQVTFSGPIKSGPYHKNKYDKMLKDIRGWLLNNRDIHSPDNREPL